MEARIILLRVLLHGAQTTPPSWRITGTAYVSDGRLITRPGTDSTHCFLKIRARDDRAALALTMITKLDRSLKREINVSGKPYIVTLAPEGLKLTVKGRRKGQELAWAALVSGEAAMAVALNASLEQAR